jgi:uncharacterized protein
MTVVEKIARLVEDACKQDANFFGYEAWTDHILSVVKYAKLLAKKMNADEEIVELAALLHDYASVSNKDWYPEHHIHGARLAREILMGLRYPEERITIIEQSILSHRGSKSIKRESVEAEVLASADAMAHFDNLHSLFYLAFKVRGLDIQSGTDFVRNKLERSWNKLIPEAKEIIKPQRQAISLLLKK